MVTSLPASTVRTPVPAVPCAQPPLLVVFRVTLPVVVMLALCQMDAPSQPPTMVTSPPAFTVRFSPPTARSAPMMLTAPSLVMSVLPVTACAPAALLVTATLALAVMVKSPFTAGPVVPVSTTFTPGAEMVSAPK